MNFAQDAFLPQYRKIVDSKVVGFLYAFCAWKRSRSRTYPLRDNKVFLWYFQKEVIFVPFSADLYIFLGICCVAIHDVYHLIAMVGTAASIGDDRTSVLFHFHESFEDTKLSPIKWQIAPDDTYTRDDLKKWIQWRIWLRSWVWTDVKYMWLDVVLQTEDGKFIRHRQLKRVEQIVEVWRQID